MGGPAIGHGAAPRAVEAGRLVPVVTLGERDAELESDEVVGRDERPDREVSSQAAHGRQPEDAVATDVGERSEEHTSELQSQSNLVCRLLLEKKKKTPTTCACLTSVRPHLHLLITVCTT